MERYSASVALFPLLVLSLLLTSALGRNHRGVHHNHRLAKLEGGVADHARSYNGSTTELPSMSALEGSGAVRLQRRQFAATTTRWTTVWVTSTTTHTITTTRHLRPETPSPEADGAGRSNSFAFDAKGSTNIAVYYGQSPGTTAQGLVELCRKPRISIVNIAFVNNFFGPGGYPTTAFGPGCDKPQNQQMANRASGLQNCTTLGEQIVTCQRQYGKKIFVSLGGYVASSSFGSMIEARQFATNLWHLFGGGTATPRLRPFGPDVVIDGFDIDNEDHSTAYWLDFVRGLKAHFAEDDRRRYYLSAAPQCPRPDQSIPMSVLRLCDFVHVQFYNNPSCQLGSPGFLDSFTAWGQDLAVAGVNGPRLLLGVPAWPDAGTGYESGPVLSQKHSITALKRRAPNFGGLMTWAGPEAVSNVDENGITFLQHMADVLDFPPR